MDDKEELAVKVMGYCTQSCATLIENGIDNFEIKFAHLGNEYVLKLAKEEEVIIMDVNP